MPAAVIKSKLPKANEFKVFYCTLALKSCSNIACAIAINLERKRNSETTLGIIGKWANMLITAWGAKNEFPQKFLPFKLCFFHSNYAAVYLSLQSNFILYNSHSFTLANAKHKDL